MRERTTLRIGDVAMAGGIVQFKGPGDAIAWDVRAGAPVDFVLAYTFEEATTDREEVVVALTIEIGGERYPTQEVVIKDRPGVTDVVRGAIYLSAGVGSAGEHEGTFRVHVRDSSEAWSGSGAPKRGERAWTGSFKLLAR